MNVNVNEVINSNNEVINEVVNKKSRGRPSKMTPEQKKEYQKNYRQQNKDKIANYESRKYNEHILENTKKNYKKYSEIINIIKFLYFNNLIDIKDLNKEEELKKLLENSKKN